MKAVKLDNSLVVIPTVTCENGDEVVVFDEELVGIGSSKWVNTVCGQFVGCNMSFMEAKYHIRRMWNKYGLVDMFNNENGVRRF